MRIRTIKPGFFTHEGIAELSPLARLMFIGLWCMADVAGRLEDRPKRIKIEVLPYDKADADAILNEIQTQGFISRYEAGGIQIIQISNFEKHQRISGKEAQTESEYPEKQMGSDGEVPGCFTESQEGKGKERKGRERSSVEKKRPNSPTEDEWVAYCSNSWADWHPECIREGFAYYESVGWRTKAGQIKDWKAAARTAHGNASQWGKLQPRAGQITPPTFDEWISEANQLVKNRVKPSAEWPYAGAEAEFQKNQANGWRFVQDWKSACAAAHSRFMAIEDAAQNRRMR